MEWTLTLTEHHYTAAEKTRLEQLGFRFRPRTGAWTLFPEHCWEVLTTPPVQITVDTMEALLSLITVVDAPIIVDAERTLEIYNGYRE